MTGPSGPSVPPGGSPRPRVSRAALREARRKQRRRQTQLIAGGVAAAVLLVGGGVVALSALGGDKDDPNDAGGQNKNDSKLLSNASALIDTDDANLLSKGKWVISRTTDGSEAAERSFACQAQRFADPAGIRTWVRVLRNPDNQDTAVEYVEVSNDAGTAQKAYGTIAGWMSECSTPQLRLLSSYQTVGLGDKGMIAVFGQPIGTDRKRFRTLAVASSGQATIVVEHNTIGVTQPRADAMLAAVTAGMRRICAETGSKCGTAPELKSSLLTTDEPKGFMAPIDLPVLSKVDKPWVSVKSAARDGTGCEKIDLTKAKATKSRWQTYVVPDADVPTEFGMDTMVAKFADYKVADQFVTTLRKAVDNCKKTYSTATVKRTEPVNWFGIRGQTWRIVYDAGSSGKLTYRVGIVRASNYASYVMFPVLKGLDISDEAFEELLIRAGQRSLDFR